MSAASSVLSHDKLLHLEAIRQSHTIPRDKEVVLLTPVMIGNNNFDAAFHPTKMAYRLGDRFNNLAPPAIERPHAGGLIIQMPLEEVK